MSVNLIHATENGEQLIIDMARVSNPENQGKPGDRLLSYLVRNKHWSPFEMVSACVEINTSRDIARQILRHRSFSFQEFSQRYAEVVEPVVLREARLQDLKNRQNSLPCNDDIVIEKWIDLQTEVINVAYNGYLEALAQGVAKEQARALLPEGLTPSKMYMHGNLRSWIHYIELRTGNGTQKEHQDIAWECFEILYEKFPTVMKTVMESR